MESLRKQAAKLLGEQKKYKRWLAVFLCLALLVTTGTVAALKLNGQAQNYEKEVLECTLEVHQHTAECYESGILPAADAADSEEPICGYADYVVHVHNDNCYDGEGTLVCQLPEIQPHVHDESCYEERKVLVCGLEETEGTDSDAADSAGGTDSDAADSAEGADGAAAAETQADAEGHVHSEACRELICGLEESEGHVHSEACRGLICGLEESEGHVHSEECRKLVCTLEESEGHIHSEACMNRVQGELICDSTEEGHEHTDECYAWTEEIVCGLEEHEGSHTHTEECYDAHACGLTEGEGGHVHTEECYDDHACGLEEGAEGHKHTEECYGEYVCGLEEHTAEDTENTEGAAESTESTEGAAESTESTEGAAAEGGHVHTEECYVTEKVLACGKLELHTHIAEAKEGEESCYDEEGKLICGIPELKEHVHGGECIKIVELSKEEIEAIQAAENAGKGEGTGTEKTEHTLYQKVYEDGSVKVIAEYDEKANIPPEAEMSVEIVTKAEDGTEPAGDTEPAEGTEAPEGTEPSEEGDSADMSDAADDGADNSADSDTDADKNDSQPEEEAGEGAEPAEAAEPAEDAEPAESTEPAENAESAESTEPIETTSEDVAAPSGETVPENGEPETNASVNTEGDTAPAGTEEDAAAEETEEKVLQGKGRMEIVEEEVTYRIVFRLNGEEIVPEGNVTFTIWDLEAEESEPEEVVYTAGAGLEQMMFSLIRKVEVFVQTEFQKTYEDGNIRVIAEYNKSAEIPEEAELRVYEITSESDPERFTDCEEKFKEAVADENAEMSTLLEIGFYVGEDEIEPKDTVTMMVQFLDGEGQPIGDPINVVHFAEDKTEVLENSEVDEEGYISFKTESFSPFAFYNAVGVMMGAGPKNSVDNKVYIYEQRDGEWVIVNVEGRLEGLDPDYINMFLNYCASSNNVYVREGNYWYEEGKYKISLEDFFYSTALQQLLSSYDPNAWKGGNFNSIKRIGISYTKDGVEHIATTTYNGSQWVSDYEIPEGSIKGVYYLKGNEESFDKPLEEFLAGGQSFKVVFNPGNGTEDKLLKSYGSIEPVTITVPASAIQEGKVIIRLPDDQSLGEEFYFSEDGTELPGTISRETAGYDYKLAGWYDVISKTYYSVENAENGYVLAQLSTQNESCIFYADWRANTYSIPENVKAPLCDEINKNGGIGTGKAEDISEFVTTRVYDYNELFNIYSTNVKGSDWSTQQWETRNDGFYADGNSESLKVASGHVLNLQKTGAKDFVFIAAISSKKSGAEKNNLIWPLGWNVLGNATSPADIGVRDLVTGVDSPLLQYLFPSPENSDKVLGVNFVGYGNYLYQLYESDENHTGYYEYDSVKNAALYDQSEGRFYICPYKQWIKRSSTSSTEYFTSFLPFNYNGAAVTGEANWRENVKDRDDNSVRADESDKLFGEESSDINYHFGMCTEIQFYLPDKPGHKVGDVYGNLIDADKGEDGRKEMVFEFSGDDDVWVFVDDQLVLDLGGMHGRLEGTINFSTGEVKDNTAFESYTETVEKTDPVTGEKKTETVTKYRKVYGVNAGKSEVLKGISSGNHTLRIYYLERGAGLSNCKIRFNIVPWYKIVPPKANTVTVTKEWIDAGRAESIDHKNDSVMVDLYQYEKDANKNSVEEGQIIGTEKLVYDAESKKLSYTWEALSPEYDYVVRERPIDNYVSSTRLETKGGYKYWTEVNTFIDEEQTSDEVLILSRGSAESSAAVEDGQTESVKALNSALGASDVTTVRGVVTSGLTEDIKWTAEKCGEGYSLKNKDGEYLNVDDKGMTTGKTPQAFKIDDTAAIRLSTVDGNIRIVYRDNNFTAEALQGNSTAQELTVRVFRNHEVSSKVKSYTITNTFLPNITIHKVDSTEPETMLSGGEFTLVRTYEKEVNDENGSGEDKSSSNTKPEFYWGVYKDGVWDDKEVQSVESALSAAQSAAVNEENKFTLDGTLVLPQLSEGDYILRELNPPKGYLIPKDEESREIKFKVRDTEQGIKILPASVESGSIVQKDKDGKEAEIKIAEVKEGTDDLILLVRNEPEPKLKLEVKFIKSSTDNKEATLGGAKFELYKKLTPEEIEKAQNDGSFKELTVDEDAKKVVQVTEGMEEVSIEGTGIFFNGSLEAGTYYLKEIAPPAGYNILKNIVTITVKLDKTSSSLTVSKDNGESAVVVEPNHAEGSWIVKVLNSKGYELPETGSMGTKPFTIGGAALIVSAAAILMYGYSVRRKKSERRLKK